MALFFKTEHTNDLEGNARVEIGKGYLGATNIALQGFYVSYRSNVDHNVIHIAAKCDVGSVEKENDINYFKYHYWCYMMDNSESYSKFVSLRTLVIAELT